MPLDAEAARRVYDRIGSFQDRQRYEEAPCRRLAELADFEGCGSMFELGCGTGRYAAKLLAEKMTPSANYLGVEVSPKMASLARERLAPWSPRARVVLLEPPARQLPADDGAFDRFLAAYVFDLLSTEDAARLIGEAARVLARGGLLALVSLTHGTTPLSRAVSRAWAAMARHWPQVVGGCEPIELTDLLTGPAWEVEHREVVVQLGVPSELVLARAAPDANLGRAPDPSDG